MKKLFHVYLFVFAMGFESMTLEMVLSRLFAPYFGTSLVVWGAVIGTVLIALSLGYYIGGRWADKKPKKSLLFSIGIIASILISVITFLFDLVFSNLNPENLFITSFDLLIFLLIVSLLFFAVPVFLFGCIVPFAVRIVTKDVSHSGTDAGKIFSYSTIGSIFGVFIPAFITIPYLGTRETILGLVLFGLLVSLFYFRKKPYLYLLILIPILLYFTSDYFYKQQSDKDLVVEETQYQLVRVTDEGDHKEMKIDTGFGIQSVYYPDAELSQNYWDSFAVLPYVMNDGKKEKDVLVLGMAGGTATAQLRKLTGEDFTFNVTGVEIDPELTEIAREEFNMNEEVVTDDARLFLQKTDKTYDLIIIDVYAKESFIPSHLATYEFFEEVESKLNEQGIVAVNINAPSKESEFYTKFTRTFAGAYNFPYSVKVNEYWNYLLIGSKEELDFNKVRNIDNPKVVTLKHWFNDVDMLTFGEGDYFSDNKSDIDQLSMKMYFEGF
ncbi:fused MFS/spermidine synthase [Patescibacteria group bacterium]|nr:fused MFS/spermidine synthase [Patescibacteria group bacterium]